MVILSLTIAKGEKQSKAQYASQRQRSQPTQRLLNVNDLGLFAQTTHQIHNSQ